MRQRVMIAMALANDPALLIADEPTTALDVSVQAQILELLGRLQGEFGIAVLLVTHNLAVVAGVADRIMVMYAGKQVETGDRLDLFRFPCHPYTMGLLASIPRDFSDARPAIVACRRLGAGRRASSPCPQGAASTHAAPTPWRSVAGSSRISSSLDAVTPSLAISTPSSAVRHGWP